MKYHVSQRSYTSYCIGTERKRERERERGRKWERKSGKIGTGREKVERISILREQRNFPAG